MEGKWPNITHRWSVILTDSKGRKSNPTFTEITSAFEGLRPCAPLGTRSTSCADTECVPWAVLTQSVLLVWNAALALPHPPSPVPALSPPPREGGSSLLPRKHLRRDKANVQIPQILAQVSFTSSKSLRSNCAAPCFSCSLLPSQSFSLLLLSSTSCVVWRRWDSRGCCWHLEPSRWLCCASSYQILLWIQDLMKFSLSLCCLAFQLFFLNFQRVQKLK